MLGNVQYEFFGFFYFLYYNSAMDLTLRPNIIKSIFLLFFLSFTFTAPIFGIEDSSGEYTIRHWSDDSGLPQNSVSSIVQTKDGYLWMTTFGGLVRFDGIKFKVFDVVNYPNMRTNRFIYLKLDRDDNLWIFPESEKGIACYSKGKMKFYDSINGFSLDTVNDVLLDLDGTYWFATMVGLVKSNSDKVRLITKSDKPEDNLFTFLFEDSKRNIWIGSKTGLNKIKNEKIEDISKKMSLPKAKIIFIEENKKGDIVFASPVSFYSYNGKKVQRKNVRDENNVAKKFVFSDQKGGLWFHSLDFISYHFKDEIQRFSKETEIANVTIKTVFKDIEENIWIGTEGAGLYCLSRKKIDTFQYVSGMPKTSIVPVCQDGKGGMWIGDNGKGLFHLQNDGVQCINKKEGLSDIIWSILPDKNGSLWAGSWGDGVYNLDKDNNINFNLNKGDILGGVICALYQDRNGSVWIGTNNGLNKYDKGKITAYTIKDGLVALDIRFITQDRKGAIWIGSAQGLSRFHEGKFINYTTENGLTANYVRAIYEDRDNVIWVGTYGGGLLRFKDNKFSSFSTENGLYDNVVSMILEDKDDNFWMSCNHGIYRANRHDLNDFADGIKSFYYCYNYGVDEGMISSECNGGGQPAGCIDKEGNIWVPTIKGVVRINPEKKNMVPPIMKIEEILLDGKRLAITDNIVLSPGKNRVIFKYTGISFEMAKKVHFKFILEGFDKKWNEAGTSRTAPYTNIPYGKYTFRVKAANNEGVWSKEDAIVKLEVEPFFYQTFLFWAIALISIAGFIFFLLEWRMRQSRIREKELNILVNDKTKELGSANKLLIDANFELEKLSIVASETNNAVVIMDEKGVIEWANEGYSRMYGKSREEYILKGRKTILTESSNPDIETVFSDFLKRKERIIYEVDYLNRDGEKIWAQTELTPIFDNENNIRKIIAIDTDITKIKEAEKIAESANMSKSEFLARMSHEIRTPMNGIIGFTDMLLDTNLSEEQIDFAKIINRSGESLISLLNDILDFSKIEAGELIFDPIDFDPEMTAFDVCELILPRISSKPIEILCRIGNNIPAFVRSDAGRFRQILINLMGNASKFTEKGEIELSLEILEKKEKKIKLYAKVRDTGIGIPEDKLNSVFEVFQQADGSTTRKYGGTGLGLSICKQIAKLFGGDVWVESEVDKGSVFHFTAWVEKSSKQPVRVWKKDFLTGKRAIIVDYSLNNLEILSCILKTEKMDVTVFSDPMDVIPEIENSFSSGKQYDICILDIQMLIMSGYDLAKKIRSLKKSISRLPLLAFSSSSFSRSKNLKEAGFDGFLPKPIRRKKLLKMIELLLNNKTEPDHKKNEMITQHFLMENSKHSIRILIVEDNSINQKLAKYMLEKAGYKITIADNGEEAVEVYFENPENFDLIFMDIQMPVLDGRSATRKIRAEGFVDIPIIAMTAEVMKGDKEKCLEAGMNDYIQKPIKRDIIFQAIKKWLLDQ